MHQTWTQPFLWWGAQGCCQTQTLQQNQWSVSLSSTSTKKPDPFCWLSQCCCFTFSTLAALSEQPVMRYYFPIKCQPLRLSAPKKKKKNTTPAQRLRLINRNRKDELRASVTFYYCSLCQITRRAVHLEYHRGPPDASICLEHKKQIWGPNMWSVAEESMTSCL